MRGRVPWVKKIEVACHKCGRVIIVHPSIAKTRKYCSLICKRAAVKGRSNFKLKGQKFPERSGKNNVTWKGEEASYSAAHHWIKSNYGNPPHCEVCGFYSEDNRKIHWANVSNEYKRDRDDWWRLCTFCHSDYDNRGVKISNAWKKRRPKQIV